MRVLVECAICKFRLWVKGASYRPNEYRAHDDADYSEGCEHMQKTGDEDCLPIDCEYDDEP